MHISIAQMELAYELLRASPPISGWHLPPADYVEFHAVPLKDSQADYEPVGSTFRIRVCVRRHATLGHLLMSMAHEMCHAYADRFALPEEAHHGPTWKRFAKKICRAHGWDFGIF